MNGSSINVLILKNINLNQQCSLVSQKQQFKHNEFARVKNNAVNLREWVIQRHKEEIVMKIVRKIKIEWKKTCDKKWKL